MYEFCKKLQKEEKDLPTNATWKVGGIEQESNDVLSYIRALQS